ncbi:hypothetical protein ACFY3N_17060 [Streptomyces sp. NPDC000348]
MRLVEPGELAQGLDDLAAPSALDERESFAQVARSYRTGRRA